MENPNILNAVEDENIFFEDINDLDKFLDRIEDHREEEI